MVCYFDRAIVEVNVRMACIDADARCFNVLAIILALILAVATRYALKPLLFREFLATADMLI